MLPFLDNEPARLRLGGVFFRRHRPIETIALADPNMKRAARSWPDHGAPLRSGSGRNRPQCPPDRGLATVTLARQLGHRFTIGIALGYLAALAEE